jgi:4-amino-4-deoxy-L-arabinose transferase-like glycosyltransferase
LKTPFLSNTIYIFLFSVLGLVCLIGLFVPLMDNDSAHHANIALHMYQTGDYATLWDGGKDYLDKPHLHFWLCAVSYKIFGVTGFAYKFPSFLFTILGTWSTYRLGKILYDSETGKLAALITACSFGYMLANNDVRMDAILTACIVFAGWQLVELVKLQKINAAILAAAGLAAGFSVKGHIGIIIPGMAILFYIAYTRKWKIILSWKWAVLVIAVVAFIIPVVYCYYLQFNLHPEKIVRGKDHINGVKFILFSQSIERFQGDHFGAVNKKDHFFFLHTFLWAFAPWSILAYIALAQRIKNFRKRNWEWLTTGTVLVMLLIVTLSGFKLPHYLNVIFPFAAILVSTLLLSKTDSPAWVKRVFIMQSVIAATFLLLVLVLNAWSFPIHSALLLFAIILLLAIVFYFFITQRLQKLQKAVGLSVAVMALFFFCFNSNFFPQVLQYQAGNRLAREIKNKIDNNRIYSWDTVYSSSFYFYTQTLWKPFSDTVTRDDKRTWILYGQENEAAINKAGYIIKDKYKAPSYHISKLTLAFLNPEKRDDQCNTLLIGEISNLK